ASITFLKSFFGFISSAYSASPTEKSCSQILSTYPAFSVSVRGDPSMFRDCLTSITNGCKLSGLKRSRLALLLETQLRHSDLYTPALIAYT
ncbi:hypothetical protein STEG23_004925, partial [Scotinomys teguina]